MNANLIRSYLKKVPAVICTAGSYIAAKNSEAEALLPWLSAGKNLFDHMSPEFVLKYEANFLSACDGNVFPFSVKGPDSEWYAVAAFDSICTRRFSGVFFFKKRERVESFVRAVPCMLTNDEKIAFASVLLGIPEDSFEPLDKEGLIDIRSSTVAIMKRLESSGIVAEFCESPEMEKTICMPVDIPLTNYLQMAFLMMTAANEISDGSTILAKLCKYGDVAELRVTVKPKSSVCGYSSVNDLMAKFGEVIPCISVCEYIAGISDCIFDIKMVEDRITLVLSINEKKYMDVDFKSRDTLRYFEECYSFVESYTRLLKSGNTEQ